MAAYYPLKGAGQKHRIRNLEYSQVKPVRQRKVKVLANVSLDDNLARMTKRFFARFLSGLFIIIVTETIFLLCNSGCIYSAAHQLLDLSMWAATTRGMVRGQIIIIIQKQPRNKKGAA